MKNEGLLKSRINPNDFKKQGWVNNVLDKLKLSDKKINASYRIPNHAIERAANEAALRSKNFGT